MIFGGVGVVGPDFELGALTDLWYEPTLSPALPLLPCLPARVPRSRYHVFGEQYS